MTQIRKVEVAAFKEEWTTLYEIEAEKLKRIFGENITAIYHIGSTSVSGLKAKPIIDMMPVVKDIELVDQLNEKMQELSYEPMGEYGIPGRRYFRKGKEKRTHHIHVFQYGSSDINRHLAFRDYLREYPNVSDRYGALKEKLAKQFPYDIDSYINGKNQFVKEIETQALDWYLKINN